MPGKQKKQPRLPKPPDISGDPETVGLPGDRVQSHERYEYVSVPQTDLGGQEAGYARFESSTFSRVDMHDTRFTGLKLIDVRLDSCDMANANWGQCELQRVELLGCRMLGYGAVEGRLQDVLFKECKARFALFHSATLKWTRFEKCDLTEADFHGADLSGVVFAGCDLTGCDMKDAKLAGTDVRGSIVDGLRVGLEELQGAIVDAAQAVTFLRLLGVTIKEEGEE
ncbi:MAG TPA: pentapeptide repeat-containing protein [Chloroflexia bacterium]|nr:pentapeptide repeat-containing protein [Chloroflexia bacterium]